MDQSWVLIDGNTGLHVGWYFWLRVLDEVNRATRYGIPFGLVLLDVEPHSLKNDRVLEDALSRVPGAVRSTDLAGLVQPKQVGILLPHQDAEAANVARDRIVERLEAAAQRAVRWTPRLLCYPDQAAEISNLLTSGWVERNNASGLQRPA
jgi:PleD family two-component response regulator